MKKSLKKLVLNRETLHALDESRMGEVVGGLSRMTCGTPCSAACTVAPCSAPSDACSFSPTCKK
jgi:hypothetical protein